MANHPPTSSSTSQAPPTSTPSDWRSAIFSQRSRRQLGFFAAGAGFVALSTLITRRSIIRRYKNSIPRFYQPSNRPNSDVNGAMEAFEALNIATINVISTAMMVSGGLLWALDISNLEDMRRMVQKRMGANGSVEDREAEEELEEWFVSVLDRKEFKHFLKEKEVSEVREAVRRKKEEREKNEQGKNA